MSYLVLDLETSCNTVKERVGNPFHNHILCIGLKYKDRLEAIPFDTPPDNYLKNISILIGHNIKYDLLYLWKNNELQEALKNGLKIWDTQLAEYILSGQKHKYPALRDIAVNKYGCKERIKHIEQGFKDGLDTTQIDIKLLLEDVKNDVLDTEQVSLKQVSLAKQKGMYNLIKAQMDALLATTEMEFNGLFVNKEILLKQKQKTEKELTVLYDKLNLLVRKYWNE